MKPKTSTTGKQQAKAATKTAQSKSNKHQGSSKKASQPNKGSSSWKQVADTSDDGRSDDEPREPRARNHKRQKNVVEIEIE